MTGYPLTYDVQVALQTPSDDKLCEVLNPSRGQVDQLEVAPCFYKILCKWLKCRKKRSLSGSRLVRNGLLLVQRGCNVWAAS